MPNLVTLEDWAAFVYGDARSGIGTLRRWARNGNLDPPAQKHGRTYFVQPDACYVDRAIENRLVYRMRRLK